MLLTHIGTSHWLHLQYMAGHWEYWGCWGRQVFLNQLCTSLCQWCSKEEGLYSLPVPGTKQVEKHWGNREPHPSSSKNMLVPWTHPTPLEFLCDPASHIFLYTGTVEWNRLPQQLKAMQTITSFKTNVKNDRIEQLLMSVTLSNVFSPWNLGTTMEISLWLFCDIPARFLKCITVSKCVGFFYFIFINHYLYPNRRWYNIHLISKNVWSLFRRVQTHSDLDDR